MLLPPYRCEAHLVSVRMPKTQSDVMASSTAAGPHTKLPLKPLGVTQPGTATEANSA